MAAFYRSKIAGEMVRYLMAGGFSAILSLTLPVVLKDGLGLHAELAVAISLTGVFAINFIAIRLFVFRSDGDKLPQLVRFVATSVLMRGTEYVSFLGLYNFLGMHYWIALFLVLTASSTCKFVVHRKYVFIATRGK